MVASPLLDDPTALSKVPHPRLLDDPTLRATVELYANDEAAFIAAFRDSWFKLTAFRAPAVRCFGEVPQSQVFPCNNALFINSTAS